MSRVKGKKWDAVFVAFLASSLCPFLFSPSRLSFSHLLLSLLSFHLCRLSPSFVVRLATKRHLYLLLSLFSSFHLPPLFLCPPLFHPGIQTSLNSWGESAGALVTAVDLIKTLQNGSGNIKVRKYDKSPRTYWTEAPCFIYEYNSHFTDIWGTGCKPTGNDVNQLDNFM